MQIIHYIGAKATVNRTSYAVNEDGGTVDIDILLDQPNCMSITIIVTPQEQLPVNASSKQCSYVVGFISSLFVASDFDNTSILVTIMPGNTNGTASIPIVKDEVVEGPETFNVTLTSGSAGVIIGTPGQTEVIIIDKINRKCLRVAYHADDVKLTVA